MKAILSDFSLKDAVHKLEQHGIHAHDDYIEFLSFMDEYAHDTFNKHLSQKTKPKDIKNTNQLF